ncbi:NPC intracellular cholesterol transporter 2-like [Anopheles arabiensis]|uniref:AGAP007197-PA n=2 Tax=gambiae species complex TaxID=44542 RepID=Q7QJ15_ANOGA|nr:NPC intracellular cholesterol transporter 2-like [Anopheles arabiensis]EAA04248.1 AGAP007197-PA [Anopheles gambiae str. PEST]
MACLKLFSVVGLVVLAATNAIGAGVATRACSGGRPAPTEVRVEGCTVPPCDLVRGSDAIMDMDFTAPFAAANLRTQVVATALGVTAPFELPADRAAACNWLLNTQCPVSANEDITYRLSMPVLLVYPRVSLTVEIDLVDDAGQSLACFELDARVVSGRAA